MVRLYERPDSPYWYAEIEVGGQTHRVSTHVPRSAKTSREAIRAAERERTQREQAWRAESYLSFQSVALQFLDAATHLRESTLHHYQNKLFDASEEIGLEPISSITPVRLRAYIKARQLKTSDIQIRKELTAISSVMEWAVDRGIDGAPEANPVRLVRKKGLAQPAARSRAIATESLKRILAVAKDDPFWHPFLTLILETGMRHGEVLGLTWDDVDLRRGCINLGANRVKTKRARVVPLSDRALHTLATQPHIPGSEFVFTNRHTCRRYVSIWKGWGRLRKKAQCSTIRIHDFRHTFASYTRRLGMDRLDRKDIMGHTTEEAHELYSTPDLATLRRQMNRFSPSTLLTQERELAVDDQTGVSEEHDISQALSTDGV